MNLMDCSWRSSIREIATTKPLFLMIYALIIGAIFSAFYVLFSLYSPNSIGSFPASPFRLSLPSLLSHGNNSETSNFSVDSIPAPSSHPSIAGLRPIWEVAHGTTMPSADSFRLTKNMITERTKDNIIIITFGNYAFMDFILTWVKHMTNLGLSNLLVGAMDIQLLEALYWRGIPVFDMGSHMSTLDVGWGSPTFHKMGREKVILIDSILPLGYELLMCDTDMVWLKDPLPYLARYPDADILVSTDQIAATVMDGGRLDDWRQVDAAYNVGIFHWRPTNSSVKLASEWKKMLMSDGKKWDQDGFNELLRRNVSDEGSGRGLFYSFDGTLKAGLLPSSLFCSGHTYFVQAVHSQLRLEPYAVHATFQYGGTEGKRHRLREAMVFYDPPEYYDVPRGFLSFRPSIPKPLLFDGRHTVASHFSLINHQMKQIRTALALASLLNRTLVMPRIWCRLDRFWFPHPGVVPGTLTPQPFLCPLDHVFKVSDMQKKLPEDEYGAGIDFREYSFFQNPSLPREVKESRLRVQLCEPGSMNLTGVSEGGLLRIPKHSTEELLRSVLGNRTDAKVIEFISVVDAFAGFSDKRVDDRFRRRVSRYTDIWCCVGGHVPGHIYYDIFWDEKADWKPVPPQTPQDDHPPFQ